MSSYAVVRVNTYDSRLDGMNFPGGEIWKYARQKTMAVRDEAQFTCPRGDTGELAASIYMSVTPVPDGEHWGCRGTVTADAYYGIWVHQGTGIYAGRGYIYPTHSKYMRFYWKKLGRRVKTKRVAGQPAQPFLQDALENVMGRF